MTTRPQPVIEESQLGELESYFRAIGLPELSGAVVPSPMSRREVTLAFPLILFEIVFLLTYYWKALPRWLWPLFLIGSVLFALARADVQRGRLGNLSNRALAGLLFAAVGMGIFRASIDPRQLVPPVALFAIDAPIQTPLDS